MTPEELLAAILAVLERMEEMQRFTTKAEVGDIDEPRRIQPQEVEPAPPISE